MKLSKSSSSSDSSSVRSTKPHFLVELLGRDAETFSDAFLVSTDGRKLPVVRSLLAMKSTFFKDKFFPQASHSKPTTRTRKVRFQFSSTRDSFNGQGNLTEGGSTDFASSSANNSRAANSSSLSCSMLPKREELNTVKPTSYPTILKIASEQQFLCANKSNESEVDSTSTSTQQVAKGTKDPETDGGKPTYAMPFLMPLLRQIVEYIYTDSVMLLKNVKAGLRPGKNEASGETVPLHPCCTVVSHIVELARTAEYFDLTKLQGKCCHLIRLMVKSKKHIACAALGAIRRKSNNPAALEKIASVLLKQVAGDLKKSFGMTSCSKTSFCDRLRTQCYGAFAGCTVMHLNKSTLEEVIRAQSGGFADTHMLRVVFYWATGRHSFLFTPQCDSETSEEAPTESEKASKENCNPLENKTAGEQFMQSPLYTVVAYGTQSAEFRRAEGKALAAMFDMIGMPPKFLYECVEASGLVEKEMLYTAYRHRALSGNRLSRLFSVSGRSGCPHRHSDATREK